MFLFQIISAMEEVVLRGILVRLRALLKGRVKHSYHVSCKTLLSTLVLSMVK